MWLLQGALLHKSPVRPNEQAGALVGCLLLPRTCPKGDWQHGVSGRGFAKARNRLNAGSLARLNTFIVEQSDALVALLNERGIRYCMRCDKANGWVAMRTFVRSGVSDALVTLNAPYKQDALDCECLAQPVRVRLVRNVCPNGRIQVVATNLPADDFTFEVFADLYHQRWRIEEGFKRLKHPAKLESVSGLTQHVLLVDVAAKVLADNLGSLLCQSASAAADLPTRRRVCNRTYAAALLQRLLPRMVLGQGCLAQWLDKAMEMLAASTHRRVKD